MANTNTSFLHDVTRSGIYKKMPSGSSPDNVFSFSDGAGSVWEISDKKASYIARLGGVLPGSDMTSKLQTIFNNAAVKEVIIDNGDITISGIITVPSTKRIYFTNGAKFIGSGIFICHTAGLKYDIQKCFGDNLDVRLIPDGDYIKPEIFGALPTSVAGGATFDNAPIFNKLFKSFYLRDYEASIGSKGRTVVPVYLSGIYNLSSTVYIRNCTPHIIGTGQVSGSGFQVYGDVASKVTKTPLVANEHYNINQNTLWGSPVGLMTVSFTGMPNGTTVYFTIIERDAADFVTAYKRGSFTYQYAGMPVLYDYRPTAKEVVHFSTTYTPSANIVAGSVPNNFTTRVVNDTAYALSSLKYSDLEVLATPLAASGSVNRPAPAYGAVPPYSIKITLTGVTNGTTLYLAHITDGSVTAQSTFTYNGADTEIKSNYIPQLHTYPKKFNEWFVIGESAPSLTDVNNKWVEYGHSISFLNKLTGSKTITSIKFNADEQMSKYLWQDKSVFNISGCDNATFETFNIYGVGKENPLMIPYSGFTSYVDISNQEFPVLTQREHTYDRIHFQTSVLPPGNLWYTYRTLKNGITIDGIYGNNDMYKLYHCNFSSCENAYYNNNQQAVGHAVDDCQFNCVDWCIVNLSGSVSVKKAFIGYGNSQGFIKVIGTSDDSITYNVEDFTSEGIQGWFWLYNSGGASWNLNIYNPQPVFWNNVNGLTKEFNLISAHRSAITNAIFNGGSWILGNFGGGGDVKIMMGGNTQKSSRLVIRDSFNSSNQLISINIDIYQSSFMLEISNTSPNWITEDNNPNNAHINRAYNSALIRTYINTNSEAWKKYAAKYTSHNYKMNLGLLLLNKDMLTFSSGTKWLDIGEDGIGTFGLCSDVKWYSIETVAVGEHIISNALPHSKIIEGVGIRTYGAGIVFDTASEYLPIIYNAMLYVGDKYDYKKWGVIISAASAPGTNNRPINRVFYNQNEDLIFTPVYSGTISSLNTNGNITATSAIFGNASNAIDNLINRKIWIVGGEYDGYEGTVTGRVSDTTISTSFSGLSLTSPVGVTFEIEGKINNITPSGVLDMIVSIYYSEGNRNVDASAYTAESYIPRLT